MTKEENNNGITAMWCIFSVISVLGFTLAIMSLIDTTTSFPCDNTACNHRVKYEYKYCPYCGHQYRTDTLFKDR